MRCVIGDSRHVRLARPDRRRLEARRSPVLLLSAPTSPRPPLRRVIGCSSAAARVVRPRNHDYASTSSSTAPLRPHPPPPTPRGVRGFMTRAGHTSPARLDAALLGKSSAAPLHSACARSPGRARAPPPFHRGLPPSSRSPPVRRARWDPYEPTPPFLLTRSTKPRPSDACCGAAKSHDTAATRWSHRLLRPPRSKRTSAAVQAAGTSRPRPDLVRSNGRRADRGRATSPSARDAEFIRPTPLARSWVASDSVE